MTSVGLDLWVFGGNSVGYITGTSFLTSFPNNELWRFTTSTRVWELVDTTVNDVGTRSYHTMTSVGLDLYIHGGYSTKSTSSGEGETYTTRGVILLLLHLDRECLVSPTDIRNNFC